MVIENLEPSPITDPIKENLGGEITELEICGSQPSARLCQARFVLKLE